MALYPVYGSIGWDDDLKAYIEDLPNAAGPFKTALSATFAGYRDLRLATRGQSDRAASLASSKLRYDTASTFRQAWADYTGWDVGSNPPPLSGGRLYGRDEAAGSAIVSRGVESGIKRYRVTIGTGPTGGPIHITMVGWSTSPAGIQANTTQTFAAGVIFLEGQYRLLVWDGSAATAQTYFANSTYNPGDIVTVTLWRDETHAGVDVIGPDGVKINTKRFLLSAVPGAAIAVYNSDARGVGGTWVGPIDGRNNTVTTIDRATENAGSSATMTTDGLGGSMRVQLPKGYDSRVGAPLAVYLHGHGGTVFSAYPVFSGTLVHKTTAALTNNGYIVVSLDAGGTAEVGSGFAAYVAAYNWVRARYAITRTVLVAESFGGVGMARLLATDGMPDVAAVVAYYPVLDLGAMYAKGGGYDTSINTAYGSLAAAQAAGADPALLPAGAFRGAPFLIFHSPGDTVVNKAWTDTFVARLGSAQATLVATSGEHGDPSNYTDARVTQVMTFLDLHTGRVA